MVATSATTFIQLGKQGWLRHLILGGRASWTLVRQVAVRSWGQCPRALLMPTGRNIQVSRLDINKKIRNDEEISRDEGDKAESLRLLCRTLLSRIVHTQIMKGAVMQRSYTLVWPIVISSLTVGFGLTDTLAGMASTLMQAAKQSRSIGPFWGSHGQFMPYFLSEVLYVVFGCLAVIGGIVLWRARRTGWLWTYVLVAPLFAAIWIHINAKPYDWGDLSSYEVNALIPLAVHMIFPVVLAFWMLSGRPSEQLAQWRRGMN